MGIGHTDGPTDKRMDGLIAAFISALPTVVARQ